MSRLRTGVAVAMLAGIFVLAVVVLGGLVAALVWTVRTRTPGGAGLGALLSTVGFVLVIALVRVARRAPHVPDGVALSPEDEPGLWALVREAADGVGTKAPDEVRLLADANAAVTEESRWLGLVAGTRVLYVGVPLLQTLTQRQLLWVLGHEMGHYSERHTALTGVTRRGLVALVEVVDGLGPRTVLGRVFRAYLAVYSRVVHAVSRSQELDADRWAATLAGPDAGVAALRAVAAATATWDTFAQDYGSVATRVGMVPQGLFSGYADFLSDPARRDPDVDRLIAEERRSPLDTHPPTSRRVERLQALPRGPGSAPAAEGADEPALLVLRDAGRVVAAVEAHLAREGSLTPVAWPRAVQVGARRRDEERAVHVMSAVDGLTSGAADLSQLFHLVAHRRGRQLAELLAGGPLDDATADALVLDVLQLVVRTALVSAGHATYVLRWDRPEVIVDESGVEVDVAELVADLPGNPDAAGWLLEVLRGEGISRTWNPGVSSTVLGPVGPEVLAVLVMKQDWHLAHPVVYVTDAGLAIRTLGYREYLSIPPISPQKTPAQLLQHSMRLDGLHLLGDPATEVVPWDDVEHVTYVDGARPRLSVRRRGGRPKTYRAVAVAGDALEQLARFNIGRMSLA